MDFMDRIPWDLGFQLRNALEKNFAIFLLIFEHQYAKI